MDLLDLEDSSSNSDNTEDCKIDPSKLLLETMTKDDDGSEDENWNIDAELSIGDDFCGVHHGEDGFVEQLGDEIGLMRWVEEMKTGEELKMLMSLKCLIETRPRSFRSLM